MRHTIESKRGLIDMAFVGWDSALVACDKAGIEAFNGRKWGDVHRPLHIFKVVLQFEETGHIA